MHKLLFCETDDSNKLSMCICTYTYTYTYIYIFTHIYIYTHIHIFDIHAIKMRGKKRAQS